MLRSRLRQWCSALGLGAALLLTLSACGSTSAPTAPTVSAGAQSLSSPFTLYANGQPIRLSIPQNLDSQTTWAMTPSLGSLVGKGREGVYTPPSGVNERTTVTLLLQGAGAQAGKQFKLDLNLLPQGLKAQATPTGPAGSTLCAGEGGSCDFTGQRLVAYGADSTFTYKTLDQGAGCNNLVFGDPLPGVVKACFIADPSTVNDTPQGYIFCATENTVCKFDGTAAVSYGIKPNFQVLTFENGVDCVNSVFGDPAPGERKNCYIKAPAPEGYTFCGLENQKCDFSGSRQVAYGANGVFKYLDQTDGTACNNATFTDPLPGVLKSCYVGASQTTVSGSLKVNIASEYSSRAKRVVTPFQSMEISQSGVLSLELPASYIYPVYLKDDQNITIAATYPAATNSLDFSARETSISMIMDSLLIVQLPRSIKLQALTKLRGSAWDKDLDDLSSKINQSSINDEEARADAAFYGYKLLDSLLSSQLSAQVIHQQPMPSAFLRILENPNDALKIDTFTFENKSKVAYSLHFYDEDSVENTYLNTLLTGASGLGFSSTFDAIFARFSPSTTTISRSNVPKPCSKYKVEYRAGEFEFSPAANGKQLDSGFQNTLTLINTIIEFSGLPIPDVSLGVLRNNPEATKGLLRLLSSSNSYNDFNNIINTDTANPNSIQNASQALSGAYGMFNGLFNIIKDLVPETPNMSVDWLSSRTDDLNASKLGWLKGIGRTAGKIIPAVRAVDMGVSFFNLMYTVGTMANDLSNKFPTGKIQFDICPKLSEPKPNPLVIRAGIGKVAEGSFEFSNIGDDRSILKWSVIGAGFDIDIQSGSLAKGANQTIKVKALCNSKEDTRIGNITVRDTESNDTKTLTVSLQCNEYKGLKDTAGYTDSYASILDSKRDYYVADCWANIGAPGMRLIPGGRVYDDLSEDYPERWTADVIWGLYVWHSNCEEKAPAGLASAASKLEQRLAQQIAQRWAKDFNVDIDYVELVEASEYVKLNLNYRHEIIVHY